MIRQKLIAVFFPPNPREFPGRRTLRTLLRTLHILTAGVLLGGHIFNQPHLVLQPWVVGAVVSGLAILLTDLHASMAFLLEVRGVAVVVKILLTVLVAVWPQHAVALLTLVLVIGSIVSHMPGRYRHRVLWWRGQVVADQRNG